VLILDYQDAHTATSSSCFTEMLLDCQRGFRPDTGQPGYLVQLRAAQGLDAAKVTDEIALSSRSDTGYAVQTGFKAPLAAHCTMVRYRKSVRFIPHTLYKE